MATLDGDLNIVVERVFNKKFFGHFQYYPQAGVDSENMGNHNFEILHRPSAINALDPYLTYYTGNGIGLNKSAVTLWKFNKNSVAYNVSSNNNYKPKVYNTLVGDKIWRTKSMDLEFYDANGASNIRGYFYLVYWVSNQLNRTPTKWKNIGTIYYQTMPPSAKHNNIEITFDNSDPEHSPHYEDKTNSILGIGGQKIYQFPAPKITAFEIISYDNNFIKGNIKWGAIGVNGEKVKYNVVINNDDFASLPSYDRKQAAYVDINEYNDPSNNIFYNFGKCEIEISNYPGYYKYNHKNEPLNTFKIGGSQATGIATLYSKTYYTNDDILNTLLTEQQRLDPSVQNTFERAFWKDGKNITDFLVLDLSANERGDVSWTHYSSYKNWYASSSKDSFIPVLEFHEDLEDVPIQYKLRIAYSEKSEERARLAALDSEDGNSICCTDWDVNEGNIDPNTNPYVTVVNKRAEFDYVARKGRGPKQGYYYISIEMVSPLKTDKEEIIYIVGSDNVNYKCPYYRLENVSSKELYRRTNQNTIVTESLKRKYARVIRSKRTKCNF